MSAGECSWELVGHTMVQLDVISEDSGQIPSSCYIRLRRFLPRPCETPTTNARKDSTYHRASILFLDVGENKIIFAASAYIGYSRVYSDLTLKSNFQ